MTVGDRLASAGCRKGMPEILTPHFMTEQQMRNTDSHPHHGEDGEGVAVEGSVDSP
ncbi:hypothetical protein [Methanofollis aquaemaris]|uniref:hypothetical protein n=1 Tax=Methanofollis aquaemaris TaxID=126734 RepID=UPI00224000BB|nr:hypothetical protein [Methanofollis aquaemaris]